MSENTEALLIGWLNQQPELEGVSAFAEVPRDRPDRFLTVERVGGANSEFVDRPSIAVQAWAQTRFAAALLADTIRIILSRIVEMEQITKLTVGSVYNWPDPDSKQARYQLTVDLAVKWNHE